MRHRFRMPARVRLESSLSGLAFVALLAAFFDPSDSAVISPHKDRYGRTLAFIFLEDGTLLNAEIIRQGYGYAYTQFPFSRMEEFRRLEGEARDARRGLWAVNP